MARRSKPNIAVELPEKGDVTIALHVLLCHPGITPITRQIGGWLIEHFNSETGRCDPSIARLSALSGAGRSTVMNATKELCELGLFEKYSHAGTARCAAYVPNWATFRNFREALSGWFRSGPALLETQPMKSHRAATFARKRKLRQKASYVQKTGPYTSEKLDVDGPENWTQTYLNNLPKEHSSERSETDAKRHGDVTPVPNESPPEGEGGERQTIDAVQTERPNGSGRGARGKAARKVALSVPGGGIPSRRQVMAEKGKDLGRNAYDAVIRDLTEIAEARRANVWTLTDTLGITDADLQGGALQELDAPGSGASWVIEQARQRAGAAAMAGGNA